MNKNVDAVDVRGLITISTKAKRRITQPFECRVFLASTSLHEVRG